MPKITGFRCVGMDGREIRCQAFGNNVAFNCPKCGHAMLAIALHNWQGSDVDHLSICPTKDFQGWIEVAPDEKLLRLKWTA